MAQRPKPEVRSALLEAAAEIFAEEGFERATLNRIVSRAGTSIGNLYKYFESKEELFAAFLPQDFPSELSARVRAQVEALRMVRDAFALDSEHPYRRASADLLRFTIEHRAQVLFLLLRAGGTAHESFFDETVQRMVELALDHAAATYPEFALTCAKERALRRIYAAFLATLARLLEQERSPGALEEAIALQAIYHLYGLRAFFLRSGAEAASSQSTSEARD